MLVAVLAPADVDGEAVERHFAGHAQDGLGGGVELHELARGADAAEHGPPERIAGLGLAIAGNPLDAAQFGDRKKDVEVGKFALSR